jgi:Tol biopolymer transport system component
VLTLEDVSPDGRALITHSTERIGMVGLSPDGKERDLSWLDWSRAGMLSSDGSTLVFTEEGEGGGSGYSVYLRKMDGSPALRLGEGEGIAFSPDGKWVLSALAGRSPAPLILLPTGIGDARPLPADSLNHDSVRGAFLPDGRRIVFTGSEAGHGRRAWLQDLEGGKARPITPEGVVGTVLSPDGKLIAARGPDQKVGLYPVDGGSARPLEGLDPNDQPLRWSEDQRFLFVSYDLRQATTARIYRVDLATGRRELWKEFSQRDPTGISRISGTDITPDGKTFVFSYGQRLADLYVTDVIR